MSWTAAGYRSRRVPEEAREEVVGLCEIVVQLQFDVWAQTIIRCEAEAVSKLIPFAQVLIDCDSWTIRKIQIPTLAVLTNLNPGDDRALTLLTWLLAVERALSLYPDPTWIPALRKLLREPSEENVSGICTVFTVVGGVRTTV